MRIVYPGCHEWMRPVAYVGGEDEAMEDADEDSEDDSVEEDDGPSYEFRIESAKLLLELEDTTATAIDVGRGRRAGCAHGLTGS